MSVVHFLISWWELKDAWRKCMKNVCNLVEHPDYIYNRICVIQVIKFHVEGDAWHCLFLSFPIPPPTLSVSLSLSPTDLLAQHKNTLTHSRCALQTKPPPRPRKQTCVCAAAWYERLEWCESRLKRCQVSQGQIAHVGTFHSLNVPTRQPGLYRNVLGNVCEVLRRSKGTFVCVRCCFQKYQLDNII